MIATIIDPQYRLNRWVVAAWDTPAIHANSNDVAPPLCARSEAQRIILRDVAIFLQTHAHNLRDHSLHELLPTMANRCEEMSKCVLKAIAPVYEDQ